MVLTEEGDSITGLLGPLISDQLYTVAPVEALPSSRTDENGIVIALSNPACTLKLESDGFTFTSTFDVLAPLFSDRLNT
jgi:hypothetical protein